MVSILQADSGSPLMYGDKLVGILSAPKKRLEKPMIFIRTEYIQMYVKDMKLELQKLSDGNL